MTDPLFLHALLAGFGIALMCAPLGCFVVWRRMAYAGDAIAHAALLGVALGLAFSLGAATGIAIIALAFALAVAALSRREDVPLDTLLGVSAHGALALALVWMALDPVLRVDLGAYLFGDVLAIGGRGLWTVWAVAVVVLVTLMLSWNDLLRMCVQEDIAAVEGVKVEHKKTLLMITLALAIAVSIPLVGVLLITSLLIIPAASARYFAATPTQMAMVAALIGVLSVAGGLFASFRWDTPSGPSIILAALVGFAVAWGWRGIRKYGE